SGNQICSSVSGSGGAMAKRYATENRQRRGETWNPPQPLAAQGARAVVARCRAHEPDLTLEAIRERLRGEKTLGGAVGPVWRFSKKILQRGLRRIDLMPPPHARSCRPSSRHRKCPVASLSMGASLSRARALSNGERARQGYATFCVRNWRGSTTH